MPDVWFDLGCAWLGTGIGNPFAEIGDDPGIARGAGLATCDYVIEDDFASLPESSGTRRDDRQGRPALPGSLNTMPLNSRQTTAPTVSLSASKDPTRHARAST